MVCANAPVYILQNTSTGSRRLEILSCGNKLRRDPQLLEREISVLFFLISYLNVHTYSHTYTHYTLHRCIYTIHI